MSWFVKALSISTPIPGTYYTVVDPGEFYEWRFKQAIPEGTVFTKQLPPSEIFTKGFVIASAQLNPDNLILKDNSYILKNSDSAEIMLEVGQIQSPNEILSKLRILQEKYNTSISNFQKTLNVRHYVITQDEKPSLYKISVISPEEVEIENFGAMPEIIETVENIEHDIRYRPPKKTGRAYEMEKIKKFLTAASFLHNKSVPMDSNKLETIVNYAELKPKTAYKTSIEKCFQHTSKDIRDLSLLIENYQKLSWIKSSLHT